VSNNTRLCESIKKKNNSPACITGAPQAIVNQNLLEPSAPFPSAAASSPNRSSCCTPGSAPSHPTTGEPQGNKNSISIPVIKNKKKSSMYTN
jgi:hypothetical protein